MNFKRWFLRIRRRWRIFVSKNETLRKTKRKFHRFFRIANDISRIAILICRIVILTQIVSHNSQNEIEETADKEFSETQAVAYFYSERWEITDSVIVREVNIGMIIFERNIIIDPQPGTKNNFIFFPYSNAKQSVFSRQHRRIL